MPTIARDPHNAKSSDHVMTRAEALAKLASVRHHCFVRGILGHRSHDRDLDQPAEDDSRQAFRIVNRLYVRLRDRLDGQSDATGSSRTRRRVAA